MVRYLIGAGIALPLMALVLFSSRGKNPASESASETLNNFDYVFDPIGDLIDNNPTGERVTLRYFNESEFAGWFDKMNPDLLKKLDEFRHRWGFPVTISPHADAVGREDPTSRSQHNYSLWGEVRAIDVFPRNSIGGYINSAAERKRALQIAKDIGFTGVGLYTDTKPGNMIHLDVRNNRSPRSPALWSRVAGQYRNINEVLA